MNLLSGIAFTTPWLLLGLVLLPILWFILRAVPPAPTLRRFPAVSLLLGLKDDESISNRTPWWLLALRLLALAAVNIGLAGPVLNPSRDQAGSGPLVVVLDASWAGATHWPDSTRQLDAELTKAGRLGRTVAVLQLTDPQPLVFQSAEAWRSRLPGLTPMPWAPSPDQVQTALADMQTIPDSFDTLWFSDSLSFEGQSDLLSAFETRGTVKVFESGQPVVGIKPATFEDSAMQISAHRSAAASDQNITILAQGRDPAGTQRTLASVDLSFSATETDAQTALSLPTELRARITHFEIQGQASAGATALTDDSLRRREIALIAGRENREGLELLSPLHYLTKVVTPSADIIDGSLLEVLPANPDVIALADVTNLTALETAETIAWVENGGLLLRFAGPRTANSDLGRETEDPLLPVRLRGGGRSVGGAMSWGEPKSLAPFPDTSPFYGLTIPDDVRVTTQVLAQPDPNLADRVIASLSDGTPLVTRKSLGLGQVVLFHITSDAESSTLPLSGLFVEMMDRLTVSSGTKSTPASVEGTVWSPMQVMDGFGTLMNADTLPGVDGPELLSGRIGPNLRPGLYGNEKRVLARNVMTKDTILEQATWPATIQVQRPSAQQEQPLGGALLSLSLILLCLDVIASLLLSGRLRNARVVAPVIALLLFTPQLKAQDASDFALEAAHELVLAHVLTGDQTVDEIALAGLRGLSDTLYFRTSIEPAAPIGVDIERDELAFFPLLYWPVTPSQPAPSEAANAKLNAYLRSGGMILFDTQDAHYARFGGTSPNGQKLRQLAAPLNIPPLEPVPKDHVLTRTFYLLQDFPGRHISPDVWVEAAPADVEQIEGMPFRNLNDGVTPVVIGGNDWAGAWAVARNGTDMLPVGRGYAGERQRELAHRFGVNLIMHVLTGNYKSDQVHVPALLDRLGQ
ncbi:DUF4159 domain-containing protein [Phaeobacter sp. NW0010-22]|uniref:DUF4159 domain-containing protein n=1 Tax=Phaeobacter sp. NW0010-22 TaxID=3135907 RepID=UPI0031091CAF